MNTFKQLHLTPGKAICYSGFRDGQHPGGYFPSYEQVKEDLLLLKKDWSYLRLYDCDEHARTKFEVIENEHFDFKVMLGAHLDAEMNILIVHGVEGYFPKINWKKIALEMKKIFNP